jgi:hypothetical protein
MDLQVGVAAAHLERAADCQRGEGPLDEQVAAPVETQVLEVDCHHR